jgi:hypothetical protein
MKRRCDHCAFWVVGEQREKDLHQDDYLGTCHRHAPSPTKGDFEYRLLHALVLIAPDDNDLLNNWEECVEANHPIWPSTSATDWCGDYKQSDQTPHEVTGPGATRLAMSVELLTDIERYLQETGTRATTFGMQSIGDPALVRQMREGRAVGFSIYSRIKRFLALQTK